MTRNMEGTARCSDCNASATYPTPGDPKSGPLVIRHADSCSVVDPPTPRVIVDERYGHISVIGHTSSGQADVTFTDLGSVLDLWAYQGINLDPQLARTLGEALVAWADRKNPPPFDLMVTLTDQALRRFVVDVLDAAEERTIKTIRLAVDEGTFKVKFDEATWSEPLTDGVLIQKGHEIP